MGLWMAVEPNVARLPSTGICPTWLGATLPLPRRAVFAVNDTPIYF